MLTAAVNATPQLDKVTSFIFVGSFLQITKILKSLCIIFGAISGIAGTALLLFIFGLHYLNQIIRF